MRASENADKPPIALKIVKSATHYTEAAEDEVR